MRIEVFVHLDGHRIKDPVISLEHRAGLNADVEIGDRLLTAANRIKAGTKYGELIKALEQLG